MERLISEYARYFEVSKHVYYDEEILKYGHSYTLNIEPGILNKLNEFGITEEKVYYYLEKGFEGYDQMLTGLENGLTVEEVEMLTDIEYKTEAITATRVLLERGFPKEKIEEFIEILLDYEYEPFDVMAEEIIEMFEKDYSIKQIREAINYNDLKYKIRDLIEDTKQAKCDDEEWKNIVISRFRDLEAAYINNAVILGTYEKSKNIYTFPFIPFETQYVARFSKSHFKKLVEENISTYEFLLRYKELVKRFEKLDEEKLEKKKIMLHKKKDYLLIHIPECWENFYVSFDSLLP